MMTVLRWRRRDDVMLVHGEPLARGIVRLDRHHQAVGGLDRPEDATRHRRRTRRIGQELERHDLAFEPTDVIRHGASPQLPFWITDRKLPAGSLNQAMSGPRFCALPRRMPFSTVFG